MFFECSRSRAHVKQYLVLCHGAHGGVTCTCGGFMTNATGGRRRIVTVSGRFALPGCGLQSWRNFCSVNRSLGTVAADLAAEKRCDRPESAACAARGFPCLERRERVCHHGWRLLCIRGYLCKAIFEVTGVLGVGPCGNGLLFVASAVLYRCKREWNCCTAAPPSLGCM